MKNIKKLLSTDIFKKFVFILTIILAVIIFLKLTINTSIDFTVIKEISDIQSIDLPDSDPNERIDKFQDLKSINDDIIGWIRIPGTNIDYPIAQGRDNSFYLDHTISKTPNSMGSVFMDYRNTNDFSDTVTMIYAHHILRGSMFGDLKEYRSDVFRHTHSQVLIFQNEKIYNYTITDFYHVDENEVMDVINENIDRDNKKIALITCSYENNKILDANLRYVVIAVLKEEL